MPKKSLKTGPSVFQEMHKLFAAARFSAAAKLYDDAVAHGTRLSMEAQLLRARIYLKQDHNRAVSFLLKHKTDRPGRDRGLWSLYAAIGFARMRDFGTSDKYFELAASSLTQQRDVALVHYHRGRRLLLEGRFQEVAAHIEAMSCDDSIETRVDQELLRSFLLGHEERYREEAECLMRLLDIIANTRESHLEAWYHAVETLAVLSRELALERGAQIAKREVDLDIEWSEDFALQRFQSLKAIGWTRALIGDNLGCFRYLRLAERTVPSPAFKVVLAVDRAHFARIIGESTWSKDSLESAEALAEGIDWNGCSGDERIGLLLLAESVAQLDNDKAQFYLARYSALDKIRSPLHLFAFDHRLDAIASYVRGLVEMGYGKPNSEQSLRRAFSIFDDIAYDWRAGRAALALYRLTGKERWLDAADVKLKRYPHSWLYEELDLAKGGKSFYVTLPPMQSKVFEMLCQRLTTSDIASILKISPHTVRNHLKAVFRAYGVNNRAALVAEAARRGVVMPPARKGSEPTTALSAKRARRVSRKAGTPD